MGFRLTRANPFDEIISEPSLELKSTNLFPRISQSEDDDTDQLFLINHPPQAAQQIESIIAHNELMNLIN